VRILGSLVLLRCDFLLNLRSATVDRPNSGVLNAHSRPSHRLSCGCFECDRAACQRGQCDPILEDPVRPIGSDVPATNHQLNREYVTMTNTGTTTRTLTGWTVRDLAHHVYTFPSFKLGPGASVRLHAGKGTNTGTDLYWGRGSYVWNNTGDKATSRDSTGALKDTCTWGDGNGIR
jgi:Lamin Tail Domain